MHILRKRRPLARFSFIVDLLRLFTMNLEQSPISDDLLDQLARRFEWHAQNIYGVSSINSSPLYAQLSSEIATDPAIL
jgi:hypothetical protein